MISTKSQNDDQIVTKHTINEQREIRKTVPVVEEKNKASLKILVVEDNLVNQKVARRIIEKLNCQVDVASNGKEGVDLAQRLSYDLIFMDMQMPEMDGLEATRKIRKFSDQAKALVPIVAMTANAMQGDREMCLDAGMDDYLSKPVKPDGVKKMLNKWKDKVRTATPEVEDKQVNKGVRIKPNLFETLRILIVDDSSIIRATFEKYLNELGIANRAIVSNVSEMQETFEQAHKDEKPFTHVFTDYHMLGGDGIEVLKHIRDYEKSNQITHPCKVIVVSTDDNQKIVLNMMKNGADNYLFKPLSMQAMKKILQE